MTTSVLIAGASGLVGSRLTEILTQKGYRVSHLGRTKRSGLIPSFIWDVDRGVIDPDAIEGIDVIINLAGSGIAEKRWTASRKKMIQESRTRSCELLFKTLNEINPHKVKTYIGASAIGYYGYSLENSILNEESKPGNDFLAQVVVDWERASDQIAATGVRVVKIRIGIVLSDRGGALTEMMGPIKWGLGSPLGSGRQMVSWVHINDLCNIFAQAIEDQNMQGAYNAVAPYPVSNKEITQSIASVLEKSLWVQNVPGFALRVVLGEMAEIVINGALVSCKKIEATGYHFQYPGIDDALKNILTNNELR